MAAVSYTHLDVYKRQLRYHGTTLLDAAAGKLPAVVLRGGAYLRHGMMGADVLANLVSAAHAKELYVILDMNLSLIHISGDLSQKRLYPRVDQPAATSHPSPKGTDGCL